MDETILRLMRWCAAHRGAAYAVEGDLCEVRLTLRLPRTGQPAQNITNFLHLSEKGLRGPDRDEYILAHLRIATDELIHAAERWLTGQTTGGGCTPTRPAGG